MMDAGALSALINNRNERLAAGTAVSAQAALGNQGKAMNEAQADKVAKEFESVFLSQMLEQMFGDSLGTDIFGNEETEGIYKSMMVEEYGKRITDAGGIGIAAYVKKELLKLQEV